MKKMLLIIALLAFAFVAFSLCKRLRKSERLPYPELSAGQEKSDTLTICIAGDSWAWLSAERGLDQCLLDSLGAKVYSKGFVGIKSKTIYEELVGGSLRELLEKRPDYMIVFAGMNDMNGQYGPEYYAHHLSLIADLLQHYGITPIFLELPRWDIYHQHSRYPFLRRLAYKGLSFVTTGSFDINSTELYRQAATTALPHGVIWIDFDAIQCENMWADDMHWTQEAYKAFAEEVYRFITKASRHIDSC